MRRIRIPHPDFTHTEKTYLDADYATGSTALTVVNNYGFENDEIAIIGGLGEEKSESKDVTGQTGHTQIDISATLKFAHNKNTVVYRYEYDQYEIYRYRAAAWTLISTSNIQWDKRETIYVDKVGLSTDAYRYRLKNNTSAAVSAYSPTIAATGYTRPMVGYMIREVRKILRDEERRIIKTDDEIIRQFNRAQEIITSRRDDWWFLFKENSAITTTADTRKYGLSTITRLNYIDTVRYRFDDGTTDNIYHLLQKPISEHDYDVRDVDEVSDDWPNSYAILPADSSDLDDVADETGVPIPSILEDYALAYCFKVKGDDKMAQIYEERFFGPQPGRDEDYGEPTGIRLLERMQNSKSKAVGQPKAMKRWRGRKAMTMFYNDNEIDRDSIKERYW